MKHYRYVILQPNGTHVVSEPPFEEPGKCAEMTNGYRNDYSPIDRLLDEVKPKPRA